MVGLTVEWWIDGKRRCSTCKDYLDSGMFHKSKRRDDGLHFRCKACERNLALVRQYGITSKQYEERLADQGGVCDICKKSPTVKRLAVDHDHACCPPEEHGTRTCGKCIRSLLCEDCNHMLGKARDNAALLRAAADYLDGWSS